MVDWKVLESAKVRKSRKKYSSDAQVCKALESCLKQILNEEDPRRMGDRKYGIYEGTYGYNLTKSIRLICQIDYNAHQIKLLAMGDHKEVYGRD